MSKYKLLRSQKNSIYASIRNLNLNPSDFIIEDTERLFKIVHKYTNHYLTIYYESSNWRYKIYYSPGETTWEVGDGTDEWNTTMKHINLWLKYLSREVEQPDFWNEPTKDIKMAELGSASDTSNSQFSQKEMEHIRTELSKIRDFINSQYKLSPGDSDLVQNKLLYLEKAAEKQGRLDWLHTAIGVTFTIVVGIGLAPNQTRELIRMVGSVLSQLFGGSIPLLP